MFAAVVKFSSVIRLVGLLERRFYRKFKIQLIYNLSSERILVCLDDFEFVRQDPADLSPVFADKAAVFDDVAFPVRRDYVQPMASNIRS